MSVHLYDRLIIGRRFEGVVIEAQPTFIRLWTRELGSVTYSTNNIGLRPGDWFEFSARRLQPSITTSSCEAYDLASIERRLPLRLLVGNGRPELEVAVLMGASRSDQALAFAQQLGKVYFNTRDLCPQERSLVQPLQVLIARVQPLENGATAFGCSWRGLGVRPLQYRLGEAAPHLGYETIEAMEVVDSNRGKMLLRKGQRWVYADKLSYYRLVESLQDEAKLSSGRFRVVAAPTMLKFGKYATALYVVPDGLE